METKKMKRPKSCPSVRWRIIHTLSSLSSSLTTSSSILNKSERKESEVKNVTSSKSCSTCNYRRKHGVCRNSTLFLSYLFVLLTSPTLSLVSSSSSLSQVNRIAYEKHFKLDRGLPLMDQSSQARTDDNNPNLVRVYAILGRNTTINCTEEIDEDQSVVPKIDIDSFWSRKNGGPLSSSSKFQVISENKLLIQEVVKEDEDTYTCIKPTEGRTGKAIHLQVVWSPKLNTDKELPQIISKPPAQTIRLECDVDARPKATVKWFKNDEEIQLGGRITTRKANLVISQTVTSDSGNYSCLASNQVANVSFPIANLTIQASLERPHKPKEVKVVSVTSNSVSLSWKAAPINNDLPIISYSVHFTPESSAVGVKEDQAITMTNSILVEKLTPSTNYSFYVRAYNKKGASEPSKTFRVQTLSMDDQSIITSTSTSPTSSSLPFTPSTIIPLKPIWVPASNLKFKLETPTSVTVTWQKFPSSTSTSDKLKITSFEVNYRRHSQPNYQYLAIESNDANTALIESLQPGVKYDFRVLASLSSTSAPANSIPNQRPPINEPSLGRWTSFQMPSRDSPTDLPLLPSDAGINNKHFNATAPGINGSIISTQTNLSWPTQVPDSPYNNINNQSSSGNVNLNFLEDDEQENLILGMVLDKFIAWSTITVVIFASLIAVCIILCCCRNG